MIKSLKVAAHDYAVTEGPLGYYGHCDTKRHRIVVRSTDTSRDKAMTVLHEAIHAICKEYGLCQYFAGETEELVVRALEVGVTNLFLENKQFAREFVKAVSKA